MSSERQLFVSSVKRQLRRPFGISRGVRTEVELVRVAVQDGENRGRGETAGLSYRSETPEVLRTQIEAAQQAVEKGASRDELLAIMPPGGARAAVDAALWDLEAKQRNQPVWALAGLSSPPRPFVTAWTIALDTPAAMAAQARDAKDRTLLKIKLGGGDGHDVERVAKVRAAAPAAQLLVDGNEGMDPDALPGTLEAFVALGVELVEQPLPRGADKALEELLSPIPLCADESYNGLDDLPAVQSRYQMVNIKLDKCGGLTAALAQIEPLKAAGKSIFVGTTVAGVLSIVPAMMLSPFARYVDLDGPLWVDEPDMKPLEQGGAMTLPERSVWG